MFRKPNPVYGVPICVQLKEQGRNTVETAGLAIRDQLSDVSSHTETFGEVQGIARALATSLSLDVRFQ